MEKAMLLLIDRGYEIKELLETPASLLNHLKEPNHAPPDWHEFNDKKAELEKELEDLEKAKTILKSYIQN